AFQPMANCAKKVIRDNGYAENIQLISKRSTELSVGPDGDMREKANILVTEVFDTELIGEGAIHTFAHALENLLEKDSIVVPVSAVVYAQVVQSEKVLKWNRLQPLHVADGIVIQPPSDVQSCAGAAAIHDIQLNQLKTSDFKCLSDPVPVFRFDFSGKTPLKFDDMSVSKFQAQHGGSCQAVFMWWELQMDVEGDILLSCAPHWAHPEPTSLQWRDHWMQAVYYLPQEINVHKGNQMNLCAFHDEYSLWFTVNKPNHDSNIIERPVCSCGAHIASSRMRIGMLNNSYRYQQYAKALERMISPKSVCLCLGDENLLPLIASKLGVSKVFTVENQAFCHRVILNYIEANDLKEKIRILTKSPEDLTSEDLSGEKVDLLLAEPFFSTSLLPWDCLRFWYLRSTLSQILIDPNHILPRKVTLKGLGVHFLDLWKIRAPAGKAESFDLTAFDKLIESSSEISDANVEPQPLWEYPCVALTHPFDVFVFDLVHPMKCEIMQNCSEVQFASDGTCNGIALWVDYELDTDIHLTTGPQCDICPGHPVEWDMYTKQGVHLLRSPVIVKDPSQNTIKYCAVFSPSDGTLTFKFEMNKITSTA
ncbi:protein arginine N-methyltransferase 7-like, partial [Limulus polyphemus]|uniref:Protein arginine N-methyltransferase 7-like n=1 Tax=Limulus polyphemus TaxID=6850 RepID=A0ABM1C101_LIMPO